MNVDKLLMDNAKSIVEAMDKVADATLPKEIVDVVKLHSNSRSVLELI